MSKKTPEADRPLYDRAKYEDLVQAYREDISQGLAADSPSLSAGSPDTLADKLNEGLSSLDHKVGDLLENLRDAIQLQYHQWEEIRDIVEQERHILSEAYNIDVPPDSLSAIVQLRRERQSQAEQALMRAKLDFQADMERRELEISLKEKSFEERCHNWDTSFAEKCKRWESEIKDRQDAVESAEHSLNQRQEEQEALWIARSEELDAAYRQRAVDLEASYEIKIQNLVAAHEEKYRQLEAQAALYQNRVPVAPTPAAPVFDPTARSPLSTPSGQPMDPWAPSTAPSAPTTQPIMGSNRTQTRIVRPIKVSSRRGNS